VTVNSTKTEIETLLTLIDMYLAEAGRAFADEKFTMAESAVLHARQKVEQARFSAAKIST
jgi:hypothetical protein